MANNASNVSAAFVLPSFDPWAQCPLVSTTHVHAFNYFGMTGLSSDRQNYLSHYFTEDSPNHVPAAAHITDSEIIEIIYFVVRFCH